MDEKLIAYFKRVLKTIVAGLIWLAVNASLGIMKAYAYINDSIEMKHVIFYLFLLLNTTALLAYYYKIWRKNLNFEL